MLNVAHRAGLSAPADTCLVWTVGVVQVLFGELDEKLEQVTSLLRTAASSQSRCTADSELTCTADRLKATALNTRDAANKSHVSCTYLPAAAAVGCILCTAC